MYAPDKEIDLAVVLTEGRFQLRQHWVEKVVLAPPSFYPGGNIKPVSQFHTPCSPGLENHELCRFYGWGGYNEEIEMVEASTIQVARMEVMSDAQCKNAESRLDINRN